MLLCTGVQGSFGIALHYGGHLFPSDGRPMKQLRRGLRAARYIWHRLRSYLVLLWYKSLYANLKVGRGVTIGPRVSLEVFEPGSLEIGDSVCIEGNCQLVAKGRLKIGDRTFVGAGTILVASDAIEIGSDALIAAYVTVRDQDHGFAEPGRVYSEQPLVISPVKIGTNVWIGTHVSVLKGVSIGDGSIIGANSVVTRDVVPLSVCAGVPAVLVRNLKERSSV